MFYSKNSLAKSMDVAPVIFVVTAACLLISIWIYSYACSPNPLQRDEVEVLIQPNTGFKVIRRILAENNVIKDDIRFEILARLIGAAHCLKAGEYSFRPGLTPYQVLGELEAGRVIQRYVTIPEGVTVSRIADILADKSKVNRDRFLELTHNSCFIHGLGLDVDTLEGYLFPDTYNVMRGWSEEAIIKMMVARLNKKWPKEYPDDGSKYPGWSRHQILTLASIVERETALPEEREKIASVFLNRLRAGMRLQADPTVIYGLPEFKGNITHKDLETPSPYNTYMINGLPPGPIGSPGLACIEAVLHALNESLSSGNKAGGYLYYVSMNDGSHYFSRTLAEHNQAVAKYQKRKREK